MKHKILFLSALVLAVLLGAGMASAAVEDDFDRPDSATLGTATNGNTWTETEAQGTFEILSSEFDYTRTAATSGNDIATLALVNVTEETYGFEVKVKSNTGDSGDFLIWRLNGAAGIGVNIRYEPANNANYIIQDPTGDVDTGVVPNTTEFDKIRVTNVNFTSDTFDLEINDVTVVTGQQFYNGNNLADINEFYTLNRDVGGGLDLTGYFMDNLCSGEDCTAAQNFSITAFDSYTASAISTFNATVEWNGTSQFYNTTSGTITTNITGELLANVTVNAPDYFQNSTVGHNTSVALDQELTPWTAIYAQNVTDSSYVENFTVLYDGTNYTADGTIAFIPLFNETAEVRVDADGFAFASQDLTADLYLRNATYPLYTTNTVNITFRDEETLEIIDDRNITAFFTGTIESYNYTTDTGTLEATLIEPQDYVITYEAEGYEQREYTFTLTNRTFNELTLYLLNESQDSIITTTVVNTVAQTQDAVVVNAFKKNLSGTNYYRVESCTTNDVGECILHLELNDVTYRFTVTDDGVARTFASTGTTVSTDQKIFSTDLRLVIDTGTDTVDDALKAGLISGSVSYNNATQTFTYSWNDPVGLDITSCLKTTRTNGANSFTVNTTCVSGASGTITQTINESDGDSFTGLGYVVIDGSERTLDVLTVITSTLANAVGLYGIFLFGFIIAGIAAFTGLWNPVVGPTLLVTTTFLAGYLGFVTIGMATMGVMASLLVLVIYLVKS